MSSSVEFSRDSCGSWTVCAASFVVQFIIYGVHSSYGIFFIAIQKEFQQTESATAWVGSQAFGLMFFLGPLTTVFCEHLGSRIVTCVGGILSFAGLLVTSFVTDFTLLYVTYGLLWGIGTSFCYFASLVVLPYHFRKYLSLAYGLAVAGAGIGVPPMAWAINDMVETYGWRKTMRILAGLSLLFCVSSLRYGSRETQLMHRQTDLQHKPKTFQSSDLRLMHKLKSNLKEFFSSHSPWRNKAFVVWAISLSLIGFGNFTPFIFLVSIAKDIGISSSQSALLIGYQAIAQTLARVAFGRLADSPRVNKVALLQGIGLLHAVNATLCPLAKNYISLVIYSFIFGACDGCMAVTFGMGTHYIVGENLMASALGNLCCVAAIGNVAGPPVAGFIFDISGKYDTAFYLSGGIMTIGVCLLFLVPWLLTKKVERCPENSMFLEKDTDTIRFTTNCNRRSGNLASFLFDKDFMMGFHSDHALQRSVSMAIIKSYESPLLSAPPLYRPSSAAADFCCAYWLNESSGYGSDSVGDASSSRCSRTEHQRLKSRFDDEDEKKKPKSSDAFCENYEFSLMKKNTGEIASSLDIYSIVFEKRMENHDSSTRSFISINSKCTDVNTCTKTFGDYSPSKSFTEYKSVLDSSQETTL